MKEIVKIIVITFIIVSVIAMLTILMTMPIEYAGTVFGILGVVTGIGIFGYIAYNLSTTKAEPTYPY